MTKIDNVLELFKKSADKNVELFMEGLKLSDSMGPSIDAFIEALYGYYYYVDDENMPHKAGEILYNQIELIRQTLTGIQDQLKNLDEEFHNVNINEE